MAVSVLEELRRFEEDMSWAGARYEELAKQYPEQYVAVDNKRVVDHDRDLPKLVSRMKTNYGERATRIAVQYVSAKEDELIL